MYAILIIRSFIIRSKQLLWLLLFTSGSLRCTENAHGEMHALFSKYDDLNTKLDVSENAKVKVELRCWQGIKSETLLKHYKRLNSQLIKNRTASYLTCGRIIGLYLLFKYISCRPEMFRGRKYAPKEQKKTDNCKDVLLFMSHDVNFRLFSTNLN